jgi:hypothetical protein
MIRFVIYSVFVLFIASCGNKEEKITSGLNFESFMFAKSNEEGTLTKVDDRLFKQGENVYILFAKCRAVPSRQ